MKVAFDCFDADRDLWEKYSNIGYAQLTGLMASENERYFELRNLHNHVLDCEVCRLRAQNSVNLCLPQWAEIEDKYFLYRDKYCREFDINTGDFGNGRLVMDLLLCGQLMLMFHPLLIARNDLSKVRLWSDTEDVEGLSRIWAVWLSEKFIEEIMHLFNREMAGIHLTWKHAIQYIAFCWCRYNIANHMLSVMPEGEAKNKLSQKITFCQRINAGDLEINGEYVKKTGNTLVLV